MDTHVWQIACRDLDPTLSECKVRVRARARVLVRVRARLGLR